MRTTCPFCRNDLNSGATVCGSCHAFMSSPLQQGGPLTPLFYYVFLWGNYLLFSIGGFGILFDGDKGGGSLIDKAQIVLIFGAIVVGGFFVLRAIGRWLSRPLWYRRN